VARRSRCQKTDQPIQLARRQAEAAEADRHAADQRSRFEQVLFRLKNYVMNKKIATPECFVSYAWGHPDHERWVEKSLATDLQKAGITVVLDRWENARIGASVPRFVERVAKSDHVIVVGTPLYQQEHDNAEPMRGFVVAAEGDLIGKRIIGTEAHKESVRRKICPFFTCCMVESMRTFVTERPTVTWRLDFSSVFAESNPQNQ
jgi:hypothetical protein